MLLEFRCSNHRSIKEEIKFSMIAGSDNTSEEFLKKFGSLNILRSAIIYGANGSGKSNFINALSFVQNLVSKSINNQPGQKIFQVPHKLCGKEEASEYNIQFVKDDIRYAYGFSVKQGLIQDEYLYYFPKGRQVKIFEREGMEIRPGDKYGKGMFDISIGILKENRLFLSCAANYSSVKVTEDAFMFFSRDVVVYDPVVNNWTEYSIELMQNNDMIRKAFVGILQALGTGVKDVRVKLENVNIADIQKGLPLSAAVQGLIASKEG